MIILGALVRQNSVVFRALFILLSLREVADHNLISSSLPTTCDIVVIVSVTIVILVIVLSVIVLLCIVFIYIYSCCWGLRCGFVVNSEVIAV